MPTYEKEDYDDHKYESAGYNTHDSSYGHDNEYSDKSYGSDYEEDYHQEPSYGRSYEEDSYEHDSYGQSYDGEPSYGDYKDDGGYESYGQSYDSKPSYEDEDEGYGSYGGNGQKYEPSYGGHYEEEYGHEYEPTVYTSEPHVERLSYGSTSY